VGEVKEENFGDDYGEERQPGVAQAFRGVAQAGEEQGEGVEGPEEREAAGAHGGEEVGKGGVGLEGEEQEERLVQDKKKACREIGSFTGDRLQSP